MEVSQKSVVITSNNPILADGLKAVVEKHLIDVKKVSVKIDVRSENTTISSPWGNLFIVNSSQQVVRVFNNPELDAKAIVLATSSISVLEEAMTRVMNNEYFIDPGFVHNEPSEDSSLTKRQIEILQLYADGVTTQDAAEKLGLSAETVRTHTKRISAILKAKTRTHAVAIAMSRGLVLPPKP